MIATLALSLLGRAAPVWLTGPARWLIDIAIVAALLGGVYFWIYHTGEKAGGAKVTRQAEQQHLDRAAEAHTDQVIAQDVTDHIGARVAAADDATTNLLRNKMKEMSDVIAAIPPTPAGGPPPVLDTDGLSAPANAVIACANRTAEAADAGTGPYPCGASDAP
jgi:hypothetical protein